MSVTSVWAKRFGGNPDAYSMIPHWFPEFNNNPNAVVIAAGMHTGDFLFSDPAEVIAYLKSQTITPETVILFDNLGEGFFDSVVASIYHTISHVGVSPRQCYYFVMAMDAAELHEKFCAAHGITDRIHIYTANLWEKHTLKHSPAPRDYVVGPRERLCVCFNRVLRTHRAAIVGGLSSLGLLDRSYVSFFPESIYGGKTWDQEVTDIEEWGSWQLAATVAHGLKKIADRFPLLLNAGVEENINYVRSDDDVYFSNSYFSLVTETYFAPTGLRSNYGEEFKDYNSVFFSEKVYKPIVMKHPFILVSRPRSLAGLRQLGYQTFAPFIDESYDLIEDEAERMAAILIEAARLSGFSDAEWAEWQRGVIPILEHNYKVISTRTDYVVARH